MVSHYLYPERGLDGVLEDTVLVDQGYSDWALTSLPPRRRDLQSYVRTEINTMASTTHPLDIESLQQMLGVSPQRRIDEANLWSESAIRTTDIDPMLRSDPVDLSWVPGPIPNESVQVETFTELYPPAFGPDRFEVLPQWDLASAVPTRLSVQEGYSAPSARYDGMLTPDNADTIQQSLQPIPWSLAAPPDPPTLTTSESQHWINEALRDPSLGYQPAVSGLGSLTAPKPNIAERWDTPAADLMPCEIDTLLSIAPVRSNGPYPPSAWLQTTDMPVYHEVPLVAHGVPSDGQPALAHGEDIQPNGTASSARALDNPSELEDTVAADLGSGRRQLEEQAAPRPGETSTGPTDASKPVAHVQTDGASLAEIPKPLQPRTMINGARYPIFDRTTGKWYKVSCGPCDQLKGNCVKCNWADSGTCDFSVTCDRCTKLSLVCDKKQAKVGLTGPRRTTSRPKPTSRLTRRRFVRTADGTAWCRLCEPCENSNHRKPCDWATDEPDINKSCTRCTSWGLVCGKKRRSTRISRKRG